MINLGKVAGLRISLWQGTITLDTMTFLEGLADETYHGYG